MVIRASNSAPTRWTVLAGMVIVFAWAYAEESSAQEITAHVQQVLDDESRYLVSDTTANAAIVSESTDGQSPQSPSTLGPVPNHPAVIEEAPEPAAAPGTPVTSTAVQDVTNVRHNWWDDFLDHTSPFHLSLDLSETYDDNIFIRPQKTSDFIANITPGIAAQFGDKTAPNGNYLSALAQFTYLDYAEHSDQNAENYFFDAEYQHQFTKLVLSIEQQARRETLTDIDVGTRVTSNVYATVATANYDYNTDLSVRGTLTQNVTSYDTAAYFDTTERVADAYVLYQLRPKLHIGIGPRFGYVTVDGGRDQTYEDLLVDFSYEMTDKTKFTLVAGPEIRQYEGSSSESITPVVDATIDYTPSDNTTLILNAHRRRIVSFGSYDQDFINNEIDLSAKQMLFQKFYVTGGAGYDHNEYVSAGPGAANPGRDDDYFYGRVGLDWRANGWMDVSAAYQYSRDDSNLSNFSFNDNQVTIKVRFDY